MEHFSNLKTYRIIFDNAETLNRNNVNSVKYGTEITTSLGDRDWKFLSNKCRELTSLSTFRCKIKNWKTDECS